MASATRNHPPKSSLTLSAAPDLLPEDARVAAQIDRVLALVDYWRSMGQRLVAETLLDELFDWVMGRPWRPIPPDALSESERRLLDGNR